MKQIKDGKFYKVVQPFFKTTQTLENINVSLLYYNSLHCILDQGKIEFYLNTNLLILLLCFVYKHSSVEIKPELQKNVLKFGYEINYRYEGMLAYSFNRIYVVTQFILPTMNDLKLSPINYNKECKYLHDLDNKNSDKIKENMRFTFLLCKTKTIHVLL